MGLPYIERSTASLAVKRNIRFSEVVSCVQPSRIAWRATRILARHTRDRAAERHADPQRFDRCPSLAERAFRRSPPPVCVSQAYLSTNCQAEDANESNANDDDKVNKKFSYRRETRATLCRSCRMLNYRCTNNANRSRVSLRSTFSNCHVLFRYLHSFVHASLQ